MHYIEGYTDDGRGNDALDSTVSEDARKDAIRRANQHAESLLEPARGSLPAGSKVFATVADGTTVKDAIHALSWEDSEIVVIGSSLTGPRKPTHSGCDR